MDKVYTNFFKLLFFVGDYLVINSDLVSLNEPS